MTKVEIAIFASENMLWWPYPFTVTPIAAVRSGRVADIELQEVSARTCLGLAAAARLTNVPIATSASVHSLSGVTDIANRICALKLLQCMASRTFQLGYCCLFDGRRRRRLRGKAIVTHSSSRLVCLIAPGARPSAALAPSWSWSLARSREDCCGRAADRRCRI